MNQHFISIMQTPGYAGTDPVRISLEDAIHKLWADEKNLKSEKGKGRLMSMGYHSDRTELGSRRESEFNSLDCIMIDCDGVQDEDGNVDKDAIEHFCKFAESYDFVLWQTSTSTAEKPKFRVLIPLTRTVKWTNYTKKAIARLFCKWTDPKASWHEEPLAPKIGTMIVHDGKQFPAEVLEKVEKQIVDDVKVQKEISRQLDMMMAYKSELRKVSVLNNEKVRHYLDTSYTKMKGNGDSDSSLYRAICVCVVAGDKETLDVVIEKALSEHWGEMELARKVRSAESSIGKKIECFH